MTPGESLVQQVALCDIYPSPRNPRRGVKQVEALAESIAAHGLLQPLVLRPRAEGGFEVVAGHRRLAALRHLGWDSALAIIRDVSEVQAYVLTLVENLQREDLSAHEEADALADLIRTRGWTTRQVAEAINRSPAYVSKRLRVFEDPVLGPAVLEGRLMRSVAEELLVAPRRRRAAMAEQAIKEAWDASTARRLLGGRSEPSSPGRTVSLAQTVAKLRQKLREVDPVDLTEREKRALRLLFGELALVARTPIGADSQAPVVPPMAVA